MTTSLLPTAATPPVAERRTRRADIQGLRAIAVLLVVLFHARLPIPGGFVGVDVFFVISGFVITAMLMREWASAGRLSFGTFYLRRFLRLTPALALLVTVVAAASILLQNPFGAQQTTARTGLGAMLLSANFAIGNAAGDYFADSATTNPLLNTWSLSVEEQFYLVFPALLVVGWLLARRFKRGLLPPVLVVLAIGLGSFALALTWSYGSSLAEPVTSFFGGAQSFAFYSPFTRAWEFAVGAILALVLHRLPRQTRPVAAGLGVAGAILILVAAFAIHDDMPFPGLLAIVPVAGTALILLAGSEVTTGLNAALATRPMVFVGDISYSWYLWHWPLIVFAALLFPNDPTVLVVAAVASLAPALLSYRFLEQPLRRLRPRTRVRTTALIVATLGIPLAMCTVLLMGANAGWGLVEPVTATPSSAASSPANGQAPTTPDTASAPTATEDGESASGEGGSLRADHVAVQAGCVNTDLNDVTCRFGPATPSGTVLLAGDSQGYALADGVIAAAEQLNFDTIVTSHTGCPFLGRESSGTHDYPCRSWQKSIVAYALEQRPDVVVIANRSAGYVHPEWKWRTAAREDGSPASSVQEAATLWEKGLDPVVSTLREAGIGVVITGAVPEMNGFTDQTSLVSKAFGSRDFTISRAESVADRKPALDVEQELAAKYPGTVVYDPIPDLCDADTCSASRDDTPVYQDETHLSRPGSLLLTDGFRGAISQAAAGSSPLPR